MSDFRMAPRRSIRCIPSLLVALALLVSLLPVPVLAQPPAVPANLPGALPLAQAGPGQFTRQPCDSFAFTLPLDWQEGRDVTCGYLEVPEEHGTPSTATLQLAVVIVKSTNPNPPPDPLVLLQGGPGGSTIDLYTQMIPYTGERLRANRDLILFDQRGTLHSRPALTCPELLQMNMEYLDVKLTREEAQEKSLEALTSCRARLEREGVNLSAFDSLENAADVDLLRQALGYEQINLYGVSYGTLLALHVKRNFPEGLRSVILDATVPPQTNFLLEAPRSQHRAFEALFDSCAQDPECNGAYPNLRQVFYEQVNRLNENPVFLELTDRDTGQKHRALLDGDSLLITTFQMMYNGEIIPFVPKALYDARSGNFSFYERILSILVFDRTMSEGMYYSVNCAEETEYDPAEYNLEDLPREIREMNENGALEFQQTCQVWDVEPLDSSAADPVSSDIPTLVLSGEFDPITPPAYGRMAVETLRDSHFVLFSNGSHGVMLKGECPDTVITSFLDNPNRPPDTTCVAQLGGPDYVTPGRVVELPVIIQLLNLEGITGPALAVYFLALLFLLSALFIYPLVWLYRLFRRPAPAAIPQPSYPGDLRPAEPYLAPPMAGEPEPRPVLYRLAPWVSTLAGLLLLVFTAVLVGILISMITNNDQRLLIGLPGSARPLFILPPLAALAAGLMLVGALTAWLRGAGSVWGRLYLTLLSLAALACVAVLAIWGMLTALI